MVIRLKRVIGECVLTFRYVGNWNLMSKQALSVMVKDFYWGRNDWPSPRDCMPLLVRGTKCIFGYLQILLKQK